MSSKSSIERSPGAVTTAKAQGRTNWRLLEAGHVSAFLKHLAEDRQVAASTQNQALNAFLRLKPLAQRRLADTAAVNCRLRR